MKKLIKRIILTLFLFILIGIPLLVYDGLKGNPIRSWLMGKGNKRTFLK